VVIRGLRARQARLLVRPTLRVVRWSPLAIAAALSGVVMFVDATADPPPPVSSLPAVALLLAAGVAFVLDDPASSTAAPTPTPLVMMRALRAVVALVPALACWGAVVPSADPGRAGLSVTVGFIAQCSVALGLAAVGARVVGDTRAGLFAGAGLIGIFVVAPLAFDVSLRLTPSSTTWAHLYGRWLLVGGIGLTVAALASSDRVTRGAVGRRPSLARRPAPLGVGTG
jgi:hypothetical protein